jgi:hypothetical protein
MVEKDLENRLAAILRNAAQDSSTLRTLQITSASSDAATLYDLLGEQPFELLQDTNDWNPDSKLMVDVAGGITPDLVLRSAASRQNRIYIEVKLHEEIRDVTPLSQVVRQFLHLLATSQFAPRGQPDIRRAVLLAAPSPWFAQEHNRIKWRYFLDRYTDLARLPKVDITLGELRLAALPKVSGAKCSNSRF